ncbi:MULTISPECIES: D-alanyl-D-alanine carboxypeptidase/D-alanyl-D-alanine-endopeptidase [unclassified Streptomyces]|uniref:D-alanyl-D-alanine carboxypeptidase/D-alanyl-D-alanine endopeptidase n=1 Tax=unclassified Streptomyces TaxID=2593676 RepID=UPI001CC07BCA|nr:MULTISPECIES: D-alanyl-D-alanine carboxypeptidase/D-alanyl-D-alanine-endopeptidase [unclassified Streptomyces]WPO72280.1 D-alanyl-D-alanine carboxypeptidase/D-alanyl-D-alanine-endopeptidase [Streptomyces sp. KN37]
MRQLAKPSAIELSRFSGKLKTWQLTAGAATLGLVISAGAVAAAGPWDSSGQRTAEREWAAAQEAGGGADHGGNTSGQGPEAAPSAPAVLAGLGAPAGTAPRPTDRALADVLDPLLKDPALGPKRSAVVLDAVSGKRVYDKAAGDELTPASTIKLATAVAALSAAGPDHRITTRTVVEPDSKDLVLIGGGDPTLTARKDGRYTDTAANLRTLAKDTARALKDRDIDEVRLSYDTSLYSGPPQHPIGPNENITPVSALMADEGRLDDSTSGPAPRSGDPAGDAAKKFAGFLKDHGIETQGEPGPTKASDRAASLAEVQSPPLSTLVERMLTHSDNDIAEALARQTALAAKEPASFDGAGDAVRAELAELKLPVSDAEIADGSGLDRADRISAELLAALLDRAADPGRPELRPVVTGLPVAGFTGTLVDRYPKESPGTGVVRAKTGTLTGVNTLAGTVVDADGRLLLFAFMTTGTTDPRAAQSSLDHMASTLANCGCR